MEHAMKRTIIASIALGFVAATPIGCGAAPDDGSVDLAAVDEGSAAVCTDPIFPNASFNLAAAVAGLSTSANASYGTATCQGRYLVDLTNTTNRSFTSWADWGDTAGTAANCGSHYVSARMDGFLPPSSTHPLGLWVTVEPEKTSFGSWSNGACNNRLNLTTLQGLTPYSKVRISARAYTMVAGDTYHFLGPAKVSVGFKQTTTGGY
jgi:hypothetical protein